MESVLKAKQRCRQYPIFLAKCNKEATNYATCVLKKDNVSLNDCSVAFKEFKTCLQKTAALAVTAYGNCHDQISEIKYTDVDYKVFTDASRYILLGQSPYNRHTYRYSPLVAILLIPNLKLHHSFGKNSEKNKPTKSNYTVAKSVNLHSKTNFIINLSIILWLYNPLTIAISTRGNCDSLAAIFVLLTLYILQCKHFYFLAGLCHGLSIHFRLYPIIYSLTLFMFLSKYAFYTTEDCKKQYFSFKTRQISNINQIKNIENTIVRTSQKDEIVEFRQVKVRKTIFKKDYLMYIIPNFNQIKLILGCLTSLSLLTYTFYVLYGYKFLYETHIYHFIRKDPRHNFSLYFYLQYLTAWVKNIGIWQKVLMVLPQIVLLLVFSIRYGLNKLSLNFSILTQTMVMVIYNTVLTSQYFVWVMAVLPLCLWQIKMTKSMMVLLLTIWFAAQGAWLLPAYLLEFQGENTFLYIWIQSVSFFCVNIAILGRLIMYFMQTREKSA
ncbi:hypothetical protein NQ317_001532 [Molorchus minor]|uniref:GPI alpha-1,4-mannosyltransferase I, catalytic subunit n=1 Tax=Molorchus minor TaxID=1323400 RepID=A0ABQ9J881_9CUCU|nr:hypothetical protein NQ317_001532 [Molorchus minor]